MSNPPLFEGKPHLVVPLVLEYIEKKDKPNIPEAERIPFTKVRNKINRTVIAPLTYAWKTESNEDSEGGVQRRRGLEETGKGCQKQLKLKEVTINSGVKRVMDGGEIALDKPNPKRKKIRDLSCLY